MKSTRKYWTFWLILLCIFVYKQFKWLVQYSNVTSFSDNEDFSFQNNDILLSDGYGANQAAESFQKLPKWLQTYITWHSEERQKSRKDEKYPIRYLVVSCFKGKRCGGFGDRMRPLPFFLLLAARTERVLIIKWTKPHDLSEFFQPPSGGLDWRSTVEFDRILKDGSTETTGFLMSGCSGASKILDHTAEDNLALCVENIGKKKDVKYFVLSWTRMFTIINQLNRLYEGWNSNDGRLREFDFVNSFGFIFRIMFEPTPSLAETIKDKMNQIGLVNDEFVSVHIRSRYPTKDVLKLSPNYSQMDKQGGLTFEGDALLKQHITNLSIDALDCTVMHSGGKPIFIATDSNETASLVVDPSSAIQSKYSQKLVTILRDKEPLHLDSDTIIDSKASDFFSTFEDLLIMGVSQCVTHGVGSYGSFGAGLINNKCRFRYQNRAGMMKCAAYH